MKLLVNSQRAVSLKDREQHSRGVNPKILSFLGQIIWNIVSLLNCFLLLREREGKSSKPTKNSWKENPWIPVFHFCKLHHCLHSHMDTYTDLS